MILGSHERRYFELTNFLHRTRWGYFAGELGIVAKMGFEGCVYMCVLCIQNGVVDRRNPTLWGILVWVSWINIYGRTFKCEMIVGVSAVNGNLAKIVYRQRKCCWGKLAMWVWMGFWQQSTNCTANFVIYIHFNILNHIFALYLCIVSSMFDSYGLFFAQNTQNIYIYLYIIQNLFRVKSHHLNFVCSVPNGFYSFFWYKFYYSAYKIFHFFLHP